MRKMRRTFPQRATVKTIMTTEKRTVSVELWEKIPKRIKSSVDDWFNHISMVQLLFLVT
jgi:hypothetical protein